MVNDALDLFSSNDPDIFVDMLIKLGTGSDKETEFNDN